MKKILLLLLILSTINSFGKGKPDKTYVIIVTKTITTKPLLRGYPIKKDSIIVTPPLLSKDYAIAYAKLFTNTQVFNIKKVLYIIKYSSKVK